MKKLKDILSEAFEDTPKVDRHQVVEGVRNFGIVGKSLYNNNNIMEIAKQLSDIAESAHNHILGEQDDWFDKISVNKNMKTLKGSVVEFQKAAKEAHTLNQRMTALYEDIGHVLNRYYDIDEAHVYGHDDEDSEMKEKLDPVGKEDGDVDNDGDKDSSDKYLLKRRKAIGKAMKKRMSEGKYSSSVRATYGGKTETFPVEVYKKKSKPVQVKTAEGFSNWRGDLTEIMTDTEDEKQIKEKSGIKNKVKINPKLGEAIEEIGGTLLEEIEIDEMDYVIESVYDELIEEGYSQDEVEYGIDTALNTIEEGYYDSAVAASKAAAAKNRGETPKRSMKDRLKSAAKKAIMGTARAAGRAMKAKAKVQAAPGRAKAKVRSIADRVKSAAKAGYAQGRGPVEKKSKSAYRGAGVGRKEKLGEESVSEAVKGQDTESRKEAAAERKRGDKRLSPSKGKGYADQQKQSISYMDKLTKKNKNVVGLVTKEDVEQVDEKINMKKADMGDVVKDFYKSKAPQFKGKSKEKRREMAIAAKLTAERGGKRLGEQQQQQDPAQRSMIGKMTQLQMKKQQMDRRKLQMKKRGEIPMNTESVES